MATTKQASQLVDKQLRDDRRQRIAAEQARLDRERAAKVNAKRAEQLAREREQRVAAVVAAGAVVEFVVPDPADSMVYKVTVNMAHEDAVARQAARALVISLAHLLAAIEYESLNAAKANGTGPNRGTRLHLILDGDSGRLAAKFGLMTAEMKAA